MFADWTTASRIAPRDYHWPRPRMTARVVNFTARTSASASSTPRQ